MNHDERCILDLKKACENPIIWTYLYFHSLLLTVKLLYGTFIGPTMKGRKGAKILK